MKSTKLVLTLLTVLCMCVTTVAFAQDDYTPPPGVLDPEVDLGEATITFIGLNLDAVNLGMETFWDTFYERMEEANALQLRLRGHPWSNYSTTF